MNKEKDIKLIDKQIRNTTEECRKKGIRLKALTLSVRTADGNVTLADETDTPVGNIVIFDFIAPQDAQGNALTNFYSEIRSAVRKSVLRLRDQHFFSAHEEVFAPFLSVYSSIEECEEEATLLFCEKGTESKKEAGALLPGLDKDLDAFIARLLKS